MKKLPLICLILSLILFCGFKVKEKPYVVLSTGDISTDNPQITKRIERCFAPRQRINYLLVLPNGVKYSGVRVQISKQSDKTKGLWGYSIENTKDIYILKGEKYYKDYIVIKSGGNYILQFFYLNKKNYPFVHKEFLVR